MARGRGAQSGLSELCVGGGPEDDGPPIQIVPIAASVDMSSVMGVVILIAAYGFGRGACACVVVCMRATCMGCAVKGGVCG